MKYDLAKRLKEAGFPQGDSFEKVISTGTAMAYLRESKPDEALLEKYEKALGELRAMYDDDKEWVYVPTCEELIEELDNCLFALSRMKNGKRTGWYCVYNYSLVDSSMHETQEYSTPLEALAELYIVIKS